MVPDDSYDHVLTGYIQQNLTNAPNIPVVNRQAFKWYDSLFSPQAYADRSEEPKWWDGSMKEEDIIPTLYLVGEFDPEVPLSARAKFKELACLYPNKVRYVEIPNMGHDLFAARVAGQFSHVGITESQNGFIDQSLGVARTYAAIFQFLDDVNAGKVNKPQIGR